MVVVFDDSIGFDGDGIVACIESNVSDDDEDDGFNSDDEGISIESDDDDDDDSFGGVGTSISDANKSIENDILSFLDDDDDDDNTDNDSSIL